MSADLLTTFPLYRCDAHLVQLLRELNLQGKESPVTRDSASACVCGYPGSWAVGAPVITA